MGANTRLQRQELKGKNGKRFKSADKTARVEAQTNAPMHGAQYGINSDKGQPKALRKLLRRSSSDVDRPAQTFESESEYVAQAGKLNYCDPPT